MKKIVLFLLVVSSFVYAKVNTIVTILPQKTFVEAIGGDKVNVTAMITPGNNPHTYEPKPSQMRDISKADIYFAIGGMEFEEAWLHKFEDQNKKMKLVDLSKGIQKIEMKEHSHGDEHEDEHHDEHDEHKDHHGHKHEKHHGHEKGHGDHKEHAHHDDHKEHHDEHKHEKEHGHHDEHKEHMAHEDHHDHHHEGPDPHIWLSPKYVKIMAKNILDALINADKSNESYYKANYSEFIKMVEMTDKKIKEILKDTPKGTPFMVFHPAWGYFAHTYNLEQVSIEIEGKEPKPKQLMHIIEEAKEEKIKAIFTAPEFSDKTAKQIANELNIKVVKASPLNPKWSENLINLARAIANK